MPPEKQSEQNKHCFDCENRHGIGATREEDHVSSTAPKSSLLLAISNADVEDGSFHDDQSDDTFSEESVKHTPTEAKTGPTAVGGHYAATAKDEPDRNETASDRNSPEAGATDPIWELKG